MSLSINLDIHHSKVFSSELETFVLDIHNPDCLVSLSTVDTFILRINTLISSEYNYTADIVLRLNKSAG